MNDNFESQLAGLDAWLKELEAMEETRTVWTRARSYWRESGEFEWPLWKRLRWVCINFRA